MLSKNALPFGVAIWGSVFRLFLAGHHGVVAFDVLFDMAEVGRKATPASALLERLVRMGWVDTADRLIRFGMSRSPGLKRAVTNAVWAFGWQRPSEIQAAFSPYTLKDVAKDIHADVLILAGTRDHFIPLEQVAEFERSLTKARSVTTAIYDEESGGDEHCQDGAVTLWQMTLFDWIDTKFPSSAGRAAGGTPTPEQTNPETEAEGELKWPWMGTGLSR